MKSPFIDFIDFQESLSTVMQPVSYMTEYIRGNLVRARSFRTDLSLNFSLAMTLGE